MSTSLLAAPTALGDPSHSFTTLFLFRPWLGLVCTRLLSIPPGYRVQYFDPPTTPSDDLVQRVGGGLLDLVAFPRTVMPVVLVLLWNSITAVQTTDCPARVLLQALPSYSRRT